ncbi:hypothetical protein CA54_19390 [Symmachiella macrocystis]|uniref:Uncharacterized protein n=1 Tax=Symmachiella macrocystis TaxID=2527985 RepID=A0A5C6BLQ4_9PLAN|nr:hypothetical protein CA54_19390 [Symmachiella macrocystis]
MLSRELSLSRRTWVLDKVAASRSACCGQNASDEYGCAVAHTSLPISDQFGDRSRQILGRRPLRIVLK